MAAAAVRCTARLESLAWPACLCPLGVLLHDSGPTGCQQARHPHHTPRRPASAGLAKYNRDGADDNPEPSPSLHGAGQPGWAAGGVAGASALLSDTTGLVGTSYYISPEISEGWAT